MTVTFQGGQSMPAFGTAAYNAIAAPSAPSGSGSYNTSTGVVSVNNTPVYTPPAQTSIWTGTNGGPTPITASAMAPTAPITLPNTPTTPSVNTSINNAGLANSLYGTTSNGNGLLTYTPPVVDPSKTPDQQSADSRLSDLISQITNTPRKENVLSSPEITAANAGIEQQNKDIQDSIARINTITNQQTAVAGQAQVDKLATTGQGRGIPEAIIGGQQAEIDKEAAIKQFGLAQQALPLQAILAAQQGNLKLAQDHLTTLYNMKSEAATNDYNYKMTMYSSIKDFVTKEEDIQLQKLQTNETRTYNEKQANIKTQDDWSKLAITNGTPALVTSINNLNPASQTFTADLGRITSQITPKTDSQIIGSASEGYYNVIKDAQGKVISSTLVKAGSGSQTATEGTDLSDALTYMKAHPEVSPDAVKQKFLQSHPSSSSAWDNYFTATDNTKQTYPTATTSPSGGLAAWWKSLW